MTDIEKGDQVSWKYGQGTAEGTVEEVKTSGQLVIESKGKEIKVNASEDNSGVHVARDGNDVVKRASALHKETKGEGNGEQADDAPAENQDGISEKVDGGSSEETRDEEAHVHQTKPHSEEENTDQETDTSEEAHENGVSKANEETNQPTTNGKHHENEEHTNGHANGHAPSAKENEDKMDITEGNAKTEVREKRPREDDDEDDYQNKQTNEQEQAEIENGKETKKAKLDVDEKTANGETNGNHLRKHQNDDAEAASKKKLSRPKKVESEAKPNQDETAARVSARTRSKA